MNILHEIISERLWTALWASVAAIGACLIHSRMSAVFYAYLIFDLLFSMQYLPALLISRRIETLSFFLFTAAWLFLGWLLARPATELAFG